MVHFFFRLAVDFHSHRPMESSFHGNLRQFVFPTLFVFDTIKPLKQHQIQCEKVTNLGIRNPLLEKHSDGQPPDLAKNTVSPVFAVHIFLDTIILLDVCSQTFHSTHMHALI